MVHSSHEYTGIDVKEKIVKNYLKSNETKCGDYKRSRPEKG